MFAAEGDVLGVGAALLAAVGVLSGLVVAGGGVLLAWLNNGGRLVKRVDELTTQVFSVQDDLKKCREDHAASLLRERDLAHDLNQTQRRVETLERGAGVVPAAPLPGVLVVGPGQIIREWSPALTVFLGWDAKEVLGTSLLKIVPHAGALPGRTAADLTSRDNTLGSGDRIQSYLLDKTGRPVPVSVQVRHWPGEPQCTTLTVTARPSAAEPEKKT